MFYGSCERFSKWLLNIIQNRMYFTKPKKVNVTMFDARVLCEANLGRL